ncbi:IclR family transcriptional regulator [Nitriliruptor alkaliphilus]|uniref:IclR family transcriptional regulator n=1 Tax=Nitriliruptor alkaliphilus TaxID=427918 RepID=UPI0006971247|nr:IclR family transcriptional regulator [Nitriliruptor alkaliphilus]
MERALAVLCAVAEDAEPTGVSEVARRTGLPKSTVHLSLQTLRHAGFVQQDETSDRYVLGLQAALIGVHAAERSAVAAALAPGMQELAARSSEAVSLGVRSDRSVVFVKRFETSHVLRTSIRTGTRMPLHASASGKCLLAEMSEDELVELYPDEVLPAQASNTIRERSTLLEELARIRERGYSHARDEFLDGISGVAVPVRFGTKVVAAVSVAGPTSRLNAEDWVADLQALTTPADPAVIAAGGVPDDPGTTTQEVEA